MGVGLWSLLTALFRMIPRFPPARSARECATSAAPAHAGISRAVPRRCNPAHMLSSPETTPPETLTDTHPVPDVLTHHNLDAELDRSRHGLRPISSRSTTDLDAGCDRSRRGTGPISAKGGRMGERVRARPGPSASVEGDERKPRLRLPSSCSPVRPGRCGRPPPPARAWGARRCRGRTARRPAGR